MQDAGYELRPTGRLRTDACLWRALNGVDTAAAGGNN